MEIAKRHHLRSDEIDSIRTRIQELFGAELPGERFEAVTFADRDEELVLIEDLPAIIQLSEGPVLSVQAANQYDPTRRIVTVDSGAVAFVSDGADVMRPGIVKADTRIQTGEPVLIAEETHGKILAIGRALTDGDEMCGNQGKVVESLYHVGDELFAFEP